MVCARMCCQREQPTWEYLTWEYPTFPAWPRGSSLSFVSSFASPGLRNPTGDLFSASKDFVPIGETWKTCNGQIHGAQEFNSAGERNIISELRDGGHRAERGVGKKLNHENVSL